MNKQIIIFCIFVLVLIVGLGYVVLNKNSSPLLSYPTKQLGTVKVLETTNFNSNPVRFILAVQAEGKIAQTPEKLLLIDKSSNKIVKELPLFPSANPKECTNHEEMAKEGDKMGMTMQEMENILTKWNSNWFSVDNLGPLDNSYKPKLADKFSVAIVYKEGAISYQSINSISGVCYQVSKTTPITPTPETQIEN